MGTSTRSILDSSASVERPTDPSDPPRGSVIRILVLASLVGLAGCGLVFYLLYGLGSRPDLDLRFLPPVNAGLNALSAFFLVRGRLFIARGREQDHRRSMGLALFFSALFLVGYLAYHTVHGDTRYPEGVAFRGPYLALLLVHVAGSILALPLVLSTCALALGGHRMLHRRIARFTFPLWLTVSVTGVMVFAALRLAGA